MLLFVFHFFVAAAPKNLITAPIHGVDAKHVIINTIELAEGKESPMHTHRGDEYAVVLEGIALQTLKGKNSMIKKGQATHIPYGQPHKVRSMRGTLKAVIIRVHDKGAPVLEIIPEK